MYEQVRLDEEPNSVVTLTRREVMDLLDRYDLEPRRALGQNFVVDPNTVRRIAALSRVGEHDRVVEIGPGLGSLTLALCETGAGVVAIEADRSLLEPLAETTKNTGCRLIHADATDLTWADEIDGEGWVLVANLPYNVGTPLVADVLDLVPKVHRLVVMVQREVADRLIAGPGDDGYGALSVKVASWAKGRRLCSVPWRVSTPRPLGDSSVVELTRHAEPAVPDDIDRGELFSLVRQAYGQRRKMMRASLRGVVDADQFEAAEVRPEARPEELALSDWVALTKAVWP